MHVFHEIITEPIRRAQADADLVRRIEEISIGSLDTEAQRLVPDERFTRYVQTLGKIDKWLGIAREHAEDVYFGTLVDGIAVVDAGAVRTEHPPRRVHAVELGTIETPSPRVTVGHLVGLLHLRGFLGDPEKASLENELQRGIDRDGRAQRMLGSDWLLRVVRDERNPHRTWVTSWLIPVDKEEYILEWIKEHQKRLQNAMRPDRMRGAVLRAARGNVDIHAVGMGEFDSFDMGDCNIRKMATSSGWKPLPEAEPHDERYDSQFGDTVQAYMHGNEEKATPYLLVLQQSARSGRGGDIRVEAVVSPALRSVIERQFQAAYQERVKRVVAERLAAPSDIVDLSSLAIALAALEVMGQRLEAYEYVRRRSRLARVAIDVLLDEYGENPLLQRSPDVQNVRSMRDIAKRSEGQPSQGIRLGWEPENVVLLLSRHALLK